jgi:hypothetical protein
MTIKNFTPPEGEEPFYYSTTIEDGVVVRHDGDPQYAVYRSGIEELRIRSNRWHRWVTENYAGAYDSLGIIREDIFLKDREINRQFMDGER